METIKYNGKEYLVTDRVKSIISKFKIDDIQLKILESKNFQEGKIPESVLILYLIDSKYKPNRDNLLVLLKSEIYSKGLISYDVVSKFSEASYLACSWTKIDYGYTEGIITEEMIKLICKMIEEDDEYVSENEETLTNMMILLGSMEHVKGLITEETIKLMATSDDSSNIKNKIISEIIDLEILTKDEIIKPILEIKNELISNIIYYIIHLDVIEKNEKENYILAMLNIENQENLLNVYNMYLAKEKVNSKEQFARNFVLYTLPLLQCGLSGVYTRKKEK